jgi:hypothetical protein
MDEKIEQLTAELKRQTYADNALFHYGRNANFDLKFTRKAKELHAPYSIQAPFKDAGSFQSRKYFTRPEGFIIQNPINGGMQVRGVVPRMRKVESLN